MKNFHEKSLLRNCLVSYPNSEAVGCNILLSSKTPGFTEGQAKGKFAADLAYSIKPEA